MEYFLGVDIGTTSSKAIAFDRQGTMLYRHAISYDMQHPQQNFSEQDPQEIFQAVTECINKVVSALEPYTPVFVSFSAMMHSLIAVNEKGNPITNCIIWADNRAASIANRLRESQTGEQLYHATGVPIHAMSPFCKLLWMKENDPVTFRDAHKFIGIKEYIFFQLFGEFIVDAGIASATGLLNLHSLQWDSAALDILQLSDSRLSKIVPVEHTVVFDPGKAKAVLKLPPATNFVLGSSDGAMANLGSGSADPDSMSVTIGTSGAVRILSAHPVTENNMSIFCYHACENEYIIGGASNNGAVVMQWFKESILQTDESYEELSRMAKSVSLVDDGLIFIPYILGERAPVWNSAARGVFFGLAVHHTKAHLVRAVMEGITFNLFSIAKFIMKKIPVTTIYANGGFAESAFWLQLLADVFNCRVLLSGSPESSALGAVVTGARALEISSEIRPEIIAEYEPNACTHELYQKQFQKFERLYKLLKNEFASPGVTATAVPA